MADNLKGIPFSSDDEGIDFPYRARCAVAHAININRIGIPAGENPWPIDLSDIYVVWFAFVRGNWKAMLSTTKPDGRIFEVSYQRENDSLIVDSYLKTHNIELTQGVDAFGRLVIDNKKDNT